MSAERSVDGAADGEGGAVPVLVLLGGLRRFGARERQVAAATVREILVQCPVPPEKLLPDGELNRDAEVLVNGRNIAFLTGLDTPLAASDRVTVFFHGARGYPGG